MSKHEIEVRLSKSQVIDIQKDMLVRLDEVKNTINHCMVEIEKPDFDKKSVLLELDRECQFINDELGYQSQFSY